MKATDLALYGIVALAAYKIGRSFSYSIPVQEPESTKMTQDAAIQPGSTQGEGANSVTPADSGSRQGSPLATEPQRSEAVGLTPTAEKVVKETLVSKRSGENPRFYDLKRDSQSVLLRNFAQDYTSPRMIEDEEIYHKCVMAANATGAPCGWIQLAVYQSGCSDYDAMIAAADCMLNYVDECISSYRSVEALRLDAIYLGRILL